MKRLLLLVALLAPLAFACGDVGVGKARRAPGPFDGEIGVENAVVALNVFLAVDGL